MNQHLVYRPQGAALELLRSREKIFGIDGPTRTGKTRAWLEKVYALLMKYPGMRALFVRQTLVSMRDTVMQTFEDEVLPPNSPILRGASRKTRTQYDFPNGSQIVLKGLDDVQNLLSGEYDIICICQAEQISLNAFQNLLTRLSGKRGPYRQLIFDCNPGPPNHWIKELEAQGLFKLHSSTHKENPMLWDPDKQEWTDIGRDYMASLEMLTGYERDRKLHGLWVNAEGARFPQLNKEIHMFNKRELWPNGLPPNMYVIMGVDYGLADPYCALWIAIDHDRNAYVYREDYEAGITADIQASRMVAKTGKNERIRAIYPDPATYSRFPGHMGPSHHTTVEFYEKAFKEDSRFGPVVRVPSTPTRRRFGFETIDAMLNHSDAHPKLYIDESCKNLWAELSGAYWWQPDSGIMKEDIDPRCPDHAITALYYALNAYYDSPTAPKPELGQTELYLEKIRKAEDEARRRIKGERKSNFYL